MNAARLFFLGIVPALLSACGLPERGQPLYPEAAAPRPKREVAVLLGDIEMVDGARLPLTESVFELLPGCHTVMTITHWGHADVGGGTMANLPSVPVALDMRGGYTYLVNVDVRIQRATGDGEFRVIAQEFDAQENLTRTFTPGSYCP